MQHTPEPGGSADPVADAVAGAAAADVTTAPAVTEAVDPQATPASGFAVRLRPPGGWSDDAGDVPGWVLVTLMTAGLVIALWAVAGPALAGVFESAIERVTSFGG
ncbi:hypothetical protein ICW40_01950 [Actinotalea ferrariae]|uniref:hypothetical protein n=1 Tax=Actinotalea ferrariae TaxID=1386098 RepID=UPI001C8CAAB6|nr:hypothetical protein [Actinotalea ferrariae]MBX9243567.1 hypothetical protein [Actinotalea ferrariae]